MAVVLAGFVLVPIALAGVWVGLRIAAAVREQFDELMPQRMVDFAGFVPLQRAGE